MKITALLVLRATPGGGADPVVLADASDVSHFGYFQRSAAEESILVGARTNASRTPFGQRKSVQQDEYMVHCYNRSGLCGLAFTDKEYPMRSAFSVLNKVLDEYEAKFGNTWLKQAEDNNEPWPYMVEALQKYQSPIEADKLLKVLSDLGETEVILHKTIEGVVARGEKLNTLVDKSTDPSAAYQTEFMVNMECEECVKSVRSKVEGLEGVKAVEVDLANQVVTILGSVSVKSLTKAIEESGRDVRLIGQGVTSESNVSAAVAEFKGPQIHGVVRFAQVSMEMARIEANFSGLTPGKHAWSINMYGDLTKGAASTGGIYILESSPSAGSISEAMGDLGTLDVGSDGAAEFSGRKLGLNVHDLIGRAVVIYENEDKSKDGLTAAVIARSAGVGQNYKKLCSCDGTIIWESTNSDFVKPSL